MTIFVVQKHDKMEFDQDYLETFYEIVAAFYSNSESEILSNIEENLGRGGMWEYATELTDEFQKLHVGREWDGEFFDEIDNFLIDKL
jgi:hypothetical protein